MIVVFFTAAFLFQRQSQDANYFALIWLPPYSNILSPTTLNKESDQVATAEYKCATLNN